MVQTPTKIRIPASFTQSTTSLLKSTAVLRHSRTMTKFVHLCVQAISRQTAGELNSCNLFIFQTLLDSVPGGMVCDVSQEIVPNVVTLLVVVIRGQAPPPPPPEKRVRTLQPNALEIVLKGLSLPGENCGDSFENLSRKCCERVTKVLRYCCETSQRLVKECRKCCESVAKVLRKSFSRFFFVARAVFQIFAGMVVYFSELLTVFVVICCCDICVFGVFCSFDLSFFVICFCVLSLRFWCSP